MTEIEQVKKADLAAKAFSALREQIRDTINEEVLFAISAIDKGELDHYIFIMGDEGGGLRLAVCQKVFQGSR